MTSPASLPHHYVIRRSGGKWVAKNQHGTKVGEFPTKREAVFTMRLLAGWRGTVVVAHR